MQWFQVNSKKDLVRFLELGNQINKQVDSYRAYSLFELESLLLKNKHFEVQAWYCLDPQNKPLGRIAAFRPYQKGQAGMGFFDSIDDQNVANAILNKGLEWLKQKGIKDLKFPIGPCERDRYWGLMVEELQPTFAENFHQSYYQRLIENYGFVLDFEQFTPRIDLRSKPLGKHQSTIDALNKRYKWDFQFFRTNERRKFAADLTEVYNQAWVDIDLGQELKVEYVLKTFNEMSLILDPDLLVFAYENGRPMAFFLAMPDANVWLSSVQSTNWLGKLQVLWNKHSRKPQTIKGLAFGIVPSAQKKGLGLALANAFYQNIKNRHYKYLELSWIGGFNPMMLSFVEKMGAKSYKKHHTYTLDINNRIT